MNPTLSEVFDGILGAMDRTFGGFDAWKDGDKLALRFELAGYDKGSISVVAENGALVVEATRDSPNHKYIVRSSTDSFRRVVAIPEEYDPERTDATYENGVLTITIEKADGKKSKKVQIK